MHVNVSALTRVIHRFQLFDFVAKKRPEGLKILYRHLYHRLGIIKT